MIAIGLTYIKPALDGYGFYRIFLNRKNSNLFLLDFNDLNIGDY